MGTCGLLHRLQEWGTGEDRASDKSLARERDLERSMCLGAVWERLL